jgi:hypothetical protein
MKIALIASQSPTPQTYASRWRLGEDVPMTRRHVVLLTAGLLVIAMAITVIAATSDTTPRTGKFPIRWTGTTATSPSQSATGSAGTVYYQGRFSSTDPQPAVTTVTP